MIQDWIRKAHRILERMAVAFAVAALPALAVQPAGWAASTGQAATDATPAEIRQFAFTPSPLMISAGTAVNWINRDAIEHSITSGSPDAPGGVFDSGFINQEQAFSFRFDEAGEYPYFCQRHPFMQATLTVSPRAP
jgi:plastocyanin